MAKLSEIIQLGSGRAGNWKVISTESVGLLTHYTTDMLIWNRENPADESCLDYSLGHGTASDQHGMNRAFRTLGLPYRYDRDYRGGGPRITRLQQEG